MSKEQNSPKTRIGTPTSDVLNLKTRGKDVLSEIVGEMSFGEAYYFIVTGRRPTPAQLTVFDAALVILMDHGLTPTALVARLVGDSLVDNPQVGVAAGVMMVGDKFAGTIGGAGALLEEGIVAADKRAWALETAKRFKDEKNACLGLATPTIARRTHALIAFLRLRARRGSKETTSNCSRFWAKR